MKQMSKVSKLRKSNVLFSVTNFVLVISMVLLLTACGKPSPESLMTNYNTNQKLIKEYAANFPGFRSLMVPISTNAFNLVKEAEKITDEDKKVEKLEAATKVFYDNDLYKALGSYSARVKSINGKIKDLGYYIKKKTKTRINGAINSANQNLYDAAEIMRNAKPTTVAAALAEIKKANSLLLDTESNLRSTKNAVKGKKKKSKLFKKRKKH